MYIKYFYINLFFILLGWLNANSQNSNNYSFSSLSDGSLTDMSTGTTQLIAPNTDSLNTGIFSNTCKVLPHYNKKYMVTRNRKVLNDFVSAYNYLHLYDGYDADLNKKTSQNRTCTGKRNNKLVQKK